jgi:hypothetical protein
VTYLSMTARTPEDWFATLEEQFHAEEVATRTKAEAEAADKQRKHEELREAARVWG